MPASITIALVASSPKVSGSRMLMPASGPMPGSMPTSVPTRQPMKAYHSTSGRKRDRESEQQAVESFPRRQNQSRPRSSGDFSALPNSQ